VPTIGKTDRCVSDAEGVGKRRNFPTLVIPGSTRDPASSDATLEEAPPRIKSGVTSKE